VAGATLDVEGGSSWAESDWLRGYRTEHDIGALEIERRYEAVPNGRVFVQLELRNTSNATVTAPAIDWQLPGNAVPSAKPLLVAAQDGERHGLTGRVLPLADDAGYRGAPTQPPRTSLLLNAVVPRERIEGERFIAAEHQYYAGYGLLAIDAKGKLAFNDWNRYQLMDRLIPVDSDQREAALTRIGRFMLEVIRRDGGWPKMHKWSHRYPDGDRFTAHTRAFPGLVYLWAHLQRRGLDVTELYERLQDTRGFLSGDFADRFPDGTPYVAYSAAEHSTDGGPEGVLNTHAHALHFIRLMMEASAIAKDEREDGWRELLLSYHAGSRGLFERLYPATKDGETLLGILDYSADAEFGNVPKYAYNTISYIGITAGYEESNEREIEMVDAVAFRPQAKDGLVGPLCRLMPAALAFADGAVMVSRIFAVGLTEALAGDRNTGAHDPDKFIVEGRGRKWIKTNASFTSDWVQGYWAERSRAPPELTFDVTASEGKHAVYWLDGRYEAMTDYEGTLSLRLPAGRYQVAVQEYADGRWSAPIEGGVAVGPSVDLRVRPKFLFTLTRDEQR